MTHSTIEVVVGGAVLALALGFAVYAGQVAGLGGTGSVYPLSASFRSAQGVNLGTDVRLAGVKVGAVTGIDLDTESFRARTTFTLRDNVTIPDDSSVVISSEGLLGGNYVEILPGASAFNYEAGDEVLDTQGAVSLISLLMKFVSGDGGQ